MSKDPKCYREMSALSHSTIQLIWRIGAGVLAVAALALAVVRLYAFIAQGPHEGTGDLGLLLSILFPLTLGLLFGYFAVIGRIPRKGDE